MSLVPREVKKYQEMFRFIRLSFAQGDRREKKTGNGKDMHRSIETNIKLCKRYLEPESMLRANLQTSSGFSSVYAGITLTQKLTQD